MLNREKTPVNLAEPTTPSPRGRGPSTSWPHIFTISGRLLQPAWVARTVAQLAQERHENRGVKHSLFGASMAPSSVSCGGVSLAEYVRNMVHDETVQRGTSFRKEVPLFLF
jgi:hypothetical protein